MDRKDEIILQQLETIRTIAENNLNRMGMDFWGNPAAPEKEKDTQEHQDLKATVSEESRKEEREELPEPEKIEDLKAELGNELADMMHYIVAIAAINDLDLERVILEKDQAASVKYHHDINLMSFMEKTEE